MTKIIVVGAGPVGLLLALRLAQAGIDLTILDKNPEIPRQAKATHYQSPAVYYLDKAGVVPACREKANGFNPGSVCWRDLQMNILGEIGFNAEKSTEVKPLDMVCLPQQELGQSVFFFTLVVAPSAFV